MAITTQYKVIEEVEIDFIYKNPSPIIMCPQFEGGERAIKVKLKNGGEDFTVPSGYTPHVYMLKFDKKVVDNICEYDGNAVMVKITKQMSFVEGRNLMRIALVSDTTGEYAQTCEIYLRVTEGADVVGAEHSTDEFEALVQYANQAKDSANKAAQSETNAKASETAAIAARKGAEDAEGRVQAIVAGNEAYTKQQANDRFALALKGTADAAKSITIYPDEGSNVVVTAHGFTKQEGSGDASPANQRPIVNGGYNKKVAVPTSGWRTANNVFYHDLTITDASTSFMILSDLAKNVGQSFTDTLKFSSAAESFDYAIGFNLNELGRMYIKAPFSSIDDLQKWITEKKAFLCYVVADKANATGIYAVIAGTGDGHTGACRELTAPLCQGDKFITKMKSGCDKVITLTGANVRAASGGNVYFGTDSGATIDNLPTLGYGFAICDKTFQFSNTTYWAGLKAGEFNYGNGQIGVYDEVNATKELAQEYYNAHPLTVWYRSTNYTEADDKPVSLETHVNWRYAFTGKEGGTLQTQSSGVKRLGLNIKSPLCKSNVGPEITCTHAKGGPTSDTADRIQSGTSNAMYLTLSTFQGADATSESANQYLADQLASGTPVIAVYPLAANVTYAHDPVDFIANPDEDGVWVITGEADGTVSAEFNKSLTHTIAEIQAALLAVAAKLSLQRSDVHGFRFQELAQIGFG